MDRQSRTRPLTSKEQAVKDLERARSLLASHLELAAEDLNPRRVITRSVQQHRWVWATAAGVAGLLLVRTLWPSKRAKFERDNSGASATKGGLIALILPSLLSLARQNALKYGTQIAQNYLSQHFSRRGGERPRA
jgi:hypothetical protein